MSVSNATLIAAVSHVCFTHTAPKTTQGPSDARRQFIEVYLESPHLSGITEQAVPPILDVQVFSHV
jgi:hypothetical protein